MPGNFYPPVNFYFSVKVVGFSEDINFQEVSGISAEIESDTVKEGGVNEFSHKLPKGVKYNNLVLKRGLVQSSPLLDWIKNAVERFVFSPKLVIVSLLDKSGKPQVNWVFNNAFPVAIKLTDFNAQDGKVMIETIELSYNYFTRGKLS
jgi:phage tail-like protein